MKSREDIYMSCLPRGDETYWVVEANSLQGLRKSVEKMKTTLTGALQWWEEVGGVTATYVPWENEHTTVYLQAMRKRKL